MKIKVNYKKNYGVDMFYPVDEWSTKFLSVMRSGKVSCFSRRQIDLLLELGFDIEVEKTEPDFKLL